MQIGEENRKVARRANSRLFSYRLLKANSNRQVLIGYRVGKGSRSDESIGNGSLKNYHRRHNRHKKSFYDLLFR